ncbi:MAG: 50S ribosomal protein L4 [Candidatus Bathyarchaeia archaeon]
MTKNVNVYDLEGKSVGKVELPECFEGPIRFDLIRRAVVALQSATFQPQGRDPMAGKRTTAQSLGVGRAMARVPRVKGDRYPRANLAAFAPSTVKGRLTFPPTPARILVKRINKKELKLATLSALAATCSIDLVKARGHRIKDDREVPIVVSDDIERVVKSSEAGKVLKSIDVWEDVLRASHRGSRAGKGSTRGRPSKSSVSVLFVVGKKSGAERAFRNFPGVKVVEVSSLNVTDLAPGTHPGRLTVWSKSAIVSVQGRFGGPA